MSEPYRNLYGAPPADLVDMTPDARQFSPLAPGAEDLGAMPAASLDDLAMLAPPGTIERRYAIAQALLALKPGARLLVLGPKDKGGSRIGKDLESFAFAHEESSKKHHRICVGRGTFDAAAVAAAISEGEPVRLDETGLWSQPGVFSWNRIDPGSALLLEHLPALSGKGADLGCGIGLLARQVLASPKVAALTLIDIDRRAVEMAKRNIEDPRAAFVWADARRHDMTGLDFIVMNPPFHDGGREDQSLGQSFIQRAAAMLRNGGVLWLTANRHLPYEKTLKPLFRRVTPVADGGGYKIYQAQK